MLRRLVRIWIATIAAFGLAGVAVADIDWGGGATRFLDRDGAPLTGTGVAVLLAIRSGGPIQPNNLLFASPEELSTPGTVSVHADNTSTVLATSNAFNAGYLLNSGVADLLEATQKRYEVGEGETLYLVVWDRDPVADNEVTEDVRYVVLSLYESGSVSNAAKTFGASFPMPPSSAFPDVDVTELQCATLFARRPNPVATSESPPSGSIDENSLSLTVTGPGISQYRYKLDDGDWITETAGTLVLTNLAEGQHVLLLIGGDDVDNWQAVDQATEYVWTVDTIAPIVTGLDDDDATRQTKSWAWGVTDADGEITYRHSIDQIPDGLPTGEYGDATSAMKDNADGTWYIHVQARDRAENESLVVTVSVMLDNTPPSLTWYWLSPESVEISFDEAVNGADALLNYTFDPELLVSAVSADRGTFRLETDRRSQGVLYRLATSDVADLAGNETDPVACGESGVLFLIRASGAQNPDILFGQVPLAEDGVDPGIDEYAEVQTGDQPYVCLVTPSGDVLRKDMRGLAELCRWKLLVDVPDTSEPIQLAWNFAFPDPEKVVYLQEVVDEAPTGKAIDMSQVHEVIVSQDTEFDIVYSTPEVRSIPFPAGWSLVGNPLMSTQSADEILDDGLRGAINIDFLWSFEDGNYQTWDRMKPLSPERGYWVYCASDSQSADIIGVRADGVILLKPGWNLVSPVGSCNMPVTQGVAGTAWYWDGENRAYRKVTTGDEFKAGCGYELEDGRGYWIFVSSGGPVAVELGCPGSP